MATTSLNISGLFFSSGKFKYIAALKWQQYI